MGRRNQYKYYSPNRGGDIMYAKEYPSIQKQTDIRFVVLEIMDEKDGRYKVWTGNEKTAIFSEFFEFSQEGFRQAVEEYTKHLTSAMRTLVSNINLEKKRLSEIFPSSQPTKEELKNLKKSERNKLKLVGLLAEMKEDGQIDADGLAAIFNRI